jgi:Cu(I)/Ag(I) efflux system membrane fusion protein
MQRYYQLSAALVKADTQAADMAGAVLKYQLDSLPVARMGLDSARMEQLAGQVGGISAELEGMLLEKAGLEGRRLSFQMVSDQLYDLLRVTGMKNTTVFRQYCPMAFNDRGAHWLSDKAEIINPYFGDEMLHCGSVTDTLKY